MRKKRFIRESGEVVKSLYPHLSENLQEIVDEFREGIETPALVEKATWGYWDEGDALKWIAEARGAGATCPVIRPIHIVRLGECDIVPNELLRKHIMRGMDDWKIAHQAHSFGNKKRTGTMPAKIPGRHYVRTGRDLPSPIERATEAVYGVIPDKNERHSARERVATQLGLRSHYSSKNQKATRSVSMFLDYDKAVAIAHEFSVPPREIGV